MNARIVGAIASIALHLALIFPWTIFHHAQSNQGSSPPVSVRLIPAEGYLRMAGESIDESHLENDKGLVNDKKACEGDSYTGIGVMMTPKGTITAIAYGSPAKKAGLQVGDFLTNTDQVNPDMVKAGMPIRVDVWRKGAQFTMMIVTETICNDRSKK